MAISSASGFSIGSSDAIDDRLVLTKAQMKSANDNVFPDVYMCVCSDDGNIYTYNKTNEIDETTGKFRIFESGGGLPEPESKDKLLLSSENETTSELEWKQVDKSEVGSTEWTGTKAEWEALSPEEKAKYDGKKVNITDDIIDSLSSLIKVKSFTHSDITITQNYGWETFNNTNIDGYTPISAFLSSSSHLFSIPVTFVLNNDSVKLGYSNVYTTSYTGSLTITVVYAKSNSVSKV